MATDAEPEVLQQTNQRVRNPIRRGHTYQYYFSPIKHALKTVPWTMTFSLYAANSYLNMKRVKEARKVYSTYPSFFMNIKTIPTYKWTCNTVDTTANWICEQEGI